MMPKVVSRTEQQHSQISLHVRPDSSVELHRLVVAREIDSASLTFAIPSVHNIIAGKAAGANVAQRHPPNANERTLKVPILKTSWYTALLFAPRSTSCFVVALLRQASRKTMRALLTSDKRSIND